MFHPGWLLDVESQISGDHHESCPVYRVGEPQLTTGQSLRGAEVGSTLPCGKKMGIGTPSVAIDGMRLSESDASPGFCAVTPHLQLGGKKERTSIFLI